MIGQRIVVAKDEVLRAIEQSKRPLSETEILLNVLSDRGLRMAEEPGETPRNAIRRHFNIAEFQRVLHQLEVQGNIEALTGAEWSERGRDFYDQRPTGRYWAARSGARPEQAKKVSVPTVMPSPRQQIHQQFCPSAATCRFRERATFASNQCKKLDELLDFNDEQLLHAKAREFYNEARKPKQKVGIQTGLYVAEQLIDPYVKIDAFDPDIDEIHPSEERPDCPACVAGKEHYHRKSDGSPVKVSDHA